MNMINKGNVKLNNDSGKASVTKAETETPAQKQAAAKLALRKQLEKTLLQVSWRNSSLPDLMVAGIFILRQHLLNKTDTGSWVCGNRVSNDR